MRSKHTNKTAPRNDDGLLLALISMAALTATFFVSNSQIGFASKSTIFVVTVLLYAILCGVVYFRPKTDEEETGDAAVENVFDEQVEAKLFALEEAHQFFGASLKYADMFRLVASRLNDIVPFSTGVLYAVSGSQSGLNFQFACGENMSEFSGLKIRKGSGLAGLALQKRETEKHDRLAEDRKIVPAKALANLHSGVAVPLFKNAEVFGVLVLYGNREKQFDQNSVELLEAAAARIAPLFISSKAFENNLANALTDSLTTLPNERAFYMVLENQIAEAQRFRGARPLTILTIDVKNFDEINRRFGHSTGDRLLAFAAEKIKNQLRQMDFLARMNGDEFFGVLPTASPATTMEVVERVRKTFVLNPFRVNTDETIYLELNFGASSFGRDGETADKLIEHALLQKQISKNAVADNKILFFPKEFVN